MEFIREILTKICDDGFDKIDLNREDSNYHLGLLVEQGFVTGIGGNRVVSGEFLCQIMGTPQLTWKGHDFLDSVRSKSSWQKIKAYISDKGADLTFEAVKIAGTEILKSQLSAS